jgi:hypothetical protein
MKNKKIILLYRISAYLLMLGIIHSVITPVFYKSFSIDALWFFGTGLSLIYLSLLNISASRLLVPWLLRIALVANITGTFFAVATVFILPEPQAYIGLCFCVIVLVSNLLTIFVCKASERK